VGSTCWDWKAATLTDANGRFLFPHLPPNHNFSVRGDWDLLSSGGAVSQTEVHLGGNGSTNDTGDINVEPVCPVAGKILLSDAKPLPPKSSYFLEDAAMGKSLSSSFDKDGSFRFPAVPGDRVLMVLRVPGYELRPGDFRLISGPATNITVSAGLTNLAFKMRPAPLSTPRP
jgi:hypothetical protein